MTKEFGSPSASVPLESVEEIWVARAETVVSLSTAEDVAAVLAQAVEALPFSGRLWDVRVTAMEQGGSSDPIAWYEREAIPRVMLADAVPPINFASKFANEVLPPRELVPRRYVAYIAATTSSSGVLEEKVLELLRSAPTLSLEFVKFALDDVAAIELEGRRTAFRDQVWERVVAHPRAGPEEWVAFAQELLAAGEAGRSAEVMRRAEKAMMGDARKADLQRRWQRVVDT